MLAPGRAPLPQDIVSAIRKRSRLICIPTIAIAEIGAGIAKLRRIGSTDRAEALGIWLSATRTSFEDRVIPFDLAAADATAQIADRAIGFRRHPGFADVAIAGTAASRNLTVVTLNLRHLEPLGIPVTDLAGLQLLQPPHLG